jgi:hypothetical protein
MNRLAGRRKLLYIAVLVIVIAIAGGGFLVYKTKLIFSLDRAQTFHSPVFGLNGKTVFYIERNSRGFSWGPGMEFFTPPASVIITRDEFAINRVDIESGTKSTVYVFNVPHKGVRKEYRNRLFGIPSTELIWEGNRLAFKIGLDVLPDGPNTRKKEWSRGFWDPDATVTETSTWAQVQDTAHPWHDGTLFGDLEVINYKGIAILVKEKGRTDHRIFLLSDTSCLSEAEILDADLKWHSHRERLERISKVKETRERLMSNYISSGLSEGDASIRTSEDLERMGLIPKGPKITAEKVVIMSGDIAEFKISDEEFRVGLFHDIEKAIKSPGTEIDFRGNYVRHSDFDTSRKINLWLGKGNKSFYVRTSEGFYLMTITPGEAGI